MPQGKRDKSPGRSVVFGRDLRANAVLQQRLVSAQQAMERDYWRLRHMETRYRSLFQVASEAVLILDAATTRLEECNPAATALFGADSARAGWLLTDRFEPEAAARVQALLERVRATGNAESVSARLAGQEAELRVSASLFRQEKTAHLLVRVAAASAAAKAGPESSAQSALLQLIEAAPDAFAVTDLDGRILTANHAFVELAQLATEAQVRGAVARALARPHRRRPERADHQPAPARRGAPVLDRDARRVRRVGRCRDFGRGRHQR